MKAVKIVLASLLMGSIAFAAAPADTTKKEVKTEKVTTKKTKKVVKADSTVTDTTKAAPADTTKKVVKTKKAKKAEVKPTAATPEAK